MFTFFKGGDFLGAIIAIVLVISLILLFKLLNKNKPSAAEIKGLEGEMRVNKILKAMKYTYFHDTLLKQGPVSSQFDHIVIFPDKTVVVIETKNKDGFISGSASDDRWTQVIGKNRYQFYNPILQNQGHIKMLYKKMDTHKLYGYKILSLVVFTSNKSTLRDTPSGVIHINELERTLRTLYKKKLFNRSRKFKKMLLFEDHSRNKREVQKHKEFAMRARYHKK